MGSNVTREDVVEHRNKYGIWDDSLDDFAGALNGEWPDHGSSRVDSRPVQDSVAVDESFWRATRSESKYGR